jgi:hypothetical protein
LKFQYEICKLISYTRQFLLNRFRKLIPTHIFLRFFSTAQCWGSFTGSRRSCPACEASRGSFQTGKALGYSVCTAQNTVLLEI